MGRVMSILPVAWSVATGLAAVSAVLGEDGPVGGDYGQPRVVVPAPADARYAHLAWPKVVRTREGTLVLACVAGRAHTVGGCPAVSCSKDGGRTFSPPRVLREFSSRADYAHCGNVALGLAGDGSVVLLAMAFTGQERNTIFGWRWADSGRMWQSVDTSALAENRTGSVYGHVFSVPGKGLAVCGHYRQPSQPHAQGIWIAFSQDDGKTWGPARRITSEKLVEPAMVCAAGRLVGLVRDATHPYRYWQALSEDKGDTWQIAPGPIANDQTRYPQPSPFITSMPNDPSRLYAFQSLRDVKGEHKGEIYLWTADARRLQWKRLGLVAALPKGAKEHTDWAYPWMTLLDDRTWFVVFYSGKGSGANSIFGLAVRPDSPNTPR